MTAFAARYFDGKTSAAREVEIARGADGFVHITGDGVSLRVAPADIRISPRLGSTPRSLRLPDGARCETAAHDAVDALLPRPGGLVHALERHWGLVAVAILFTFGFLWVSFEYGLPGVARQVARAVPPEMEIGIGEQSLAALDERFLEPSRLEEVDRQRVRAAFERVTGTLEPPMRARLELRSSEVMGANAFALPSGIVVMTDEMVALATGDEQIAAVLAHELGHVHHRHIMRSILQNSITAVLLAALLGDMTSVTGLAASIPTFLVEQHYSREFEYEADAFALAWMRAQGIDDEQFAVILEAVNNQHGGGSDDDDITRYLSTHPSMRERTEAIRR